MVTTYYCRPRPGLAPPPPPAVPVLPAAMRALVAQLRLQHRNKIALRQKLRANGVTWPPEVWQRVRLHARWQGRPLLGTLVQRDGGYYYVVSDNTSPQRDGDYATECYEGEISPATTRSHRPLPPAWLPARFFARYAPHLHQPTATYDVQLVDGTEARECYAKRDAAGQFAFQEINSPYRRLSFGLLAALRPHQL